MLKREQLPPAYAVSCSDNSRTLFELDSLRLISETAVYKKGLHSRSVRLLGLELSLILQRL